MKKKHKQAKYPGTDWRLVVTILIFVGWLIVMLYLGYQVYGSKDYY